MANQNAWLEQLYEYKKNQDGSIQAAEAIFENKYKPPNLPDFSSFQSKYHQVQKAVVRKGLLGFVAEGRVEPFRHTNSCVKLFSAKLLLLLLLVEFKP